MMKRLVSWSMRTAVSSLFAPLLGDEYRVIVQGMWAYCVQPGDPGVMLWGAAGPHRDSMTPDPAVLRREAPSILTIWLPLTDVTPLHSCLYCLPASCDPAFFTDAQTVPEQIRWQDVRAMPAAAGSVLAWSPNLAHWGSRSSPLAPGPRISVSVYFERGDCPLRHPFTMRFGDRVTFDDRLRWIETNLDRPGLLTGGEGDR